jgi:hypothetical protein
MSLAVRTFIALSASTLVLSACLVDKETGSGDARIYRTTPDASTSDTDAGDAGNSDAGDGGDAGPLTNSISGTLSGTTLTIADAVAFDSSGLGVGGTGDLWVLLSKSSDMCYRLSSGARVGSSASLSFYLLQTDGFSRYVAATPGTYIVSSNQPGANVQVAAALYTTTDSACAPTDVTASNGEVVLNSVATTGGGITDGTFDFTFGTDHVTGSFSAAFCPGPVQSGGNICLN